MKLTLRSKYLISTLIWIAATLFLFIIFAKANPAIHKRIYIFSILFGAELYLWIRIKSTFSLFNSTFERRKDGCKIAVTALYWLPAAIAIIYLLHIYFIGIQHLNKTWYSNILGAILMIYLAKGVSCVLLICGEIISLICRKRSGNPEYLLITRKKILPLSTMLFFAILIGTLPFYATRSHFRTTRHTWNILPQNFAIDSLKAVHISDLHLCTWNGTKAMEHLVNKINKENADFIFITGDLVHFTSDEIIPYLNILNQLRATYGVFSIMGNHDYSRYAHFNTESDRLKDIEQNINFQQQMGWQILCNESCKISIDSIGNSITIAGLEYWSPAKPSISFGDFVKTYQNVSDSDFVILLTHAPQGWRDALDRNYPAQLTLSGHTHGMQLGILTDKWKFSPGALRYQEWGGKYEQDGNILYVNVGLASAGIPIRVGMLPEIGVYTLGKSAKQKKITS